MSLPILPKNVYLEEAITELGMKGMPITRALNTILMYSKDYGLNIYFDDNVTGIDSDVDIGEIFHGDGISEERELVDFMVAKSNQMVRIDGPKSIVNAHVYFYADVLREYVAVSRFSQNGTDYSIPDKSGAKLLDISLDYDKFYIDKDELLNFKEEMDRGNRTSKPVKSQHTLGSSSADITALALLARDMAEREDGYSHGNKVNSSAFKNHIVNLANAYGVSKHGLNSLDDRINKVLKFLDLKEIKK
jgi:hypothetical protein